MDFFAGMVRNPCLCPLVGGVEGPRHPLSDAQGVEELESCKVPFAFNSVGGGDGAIAVSVISGDIWHFVG